MSEPPFGLPRVDVDSLLSEFGATIAAKYQTKSGEPEDRIRAPFERLLQKYGQFVGLRVVPCGEILLSDLGVKPDYAVEVAGVRVGYAELKAPGKRVPTVRQPRGRDGAQWEKLRLLPNVLYTDGQCWALFRTGKIVGKAAWLSPDVETAGAKLRVLDNQFELLLRDFLTWKPVRPRTIKELVSGVATLCRLLRDEVAGIMGEEKLRRSKPAHFTRLASEWRGLLFPSLTDIEFANDYAQTVTFALLLARVEGIEFDNRSVAEIALLLGKKHLLMGRALGVLVNDNVERHSIVIDTMLRIIGVVDWETFDRDAFMTLFQYFLKEYDPEQRKRTGSYYTPDGLVQFMVRFVDELLSKRLDRPRGFASDDVIVVDPAMGTGSFLARIVDRAATTVDRLEGPGQVPARLRALARRIIGFEKQAAPYAISQLRLHSLLKNGYGAEPPQEEFRFLTDTLDNPYLQELEFGSVYEELQQSRRGANKIKREVPVMVVISNPPYLRQVAGTAPWIEEPGHDRNARPNLDAFRAPGNGKYEHVLSSSSTYFWRWATWKAFDAHPKEPSGVVAFVTTASFLDARGFAGMRDYLRHTADEGWIVDLSPESFRPSASNRIFPENRNRVCVAVFIRQGAPNPDRPARIRYTSVAGRRGEKLEALSRITLDGPGWTECSADWKSTMLPPPSDEWADHPGLRDLFPCALPGVKPNRTWLYAPSPDVLLRRWEQLVAAPRDERIRLFKETDSRRLDSKPLALPGFTTPIRTIAQEQGECAVPVRVSFRPFDRQWTIPDARLHHRPSPDLWRVLGDGQIYMIEQHSHAFAQGPGVLFSSFPPDMDNFLGHHGGRVLPLFKDSDGKVDNLAPGLGELLRNLYGQAVYAADVMCYVAAVVAHRGYVASFAEQLRSPGIRVPLTRNPEIWRDAVVVGRRVIYLHTYGLRCVDADVVAGHDGVWLPLAERPRVVDAISDSCGEVPSSFSYDEASQVLTIGDGKVSRIAPAVWNYQIGTTRVVKKWIEYRLADPAYKWSSPLNDVRLDIWDDRITGELLELLNILALCISVEPFQQAILGRVMASSLVGVSELMDAGILPVPKSSTKVSAPSNGRATLLPGLGLDSSLGFDPV